MLARYQQFIASGEFSPDPAQEKIVHQLQQVLDEWRKKENANFISKLFLNSNVISGFYLWGGVGAGKTWLMDMFYHELPTQKKLRLHFHQFLFGVHKALKKFQGQLDPLKLVAQELAEQADFICFDEFMVSDITDAMILGNLLSALFAEGITLISTSNVKPEDLYRNGLQRDRFLPAIELLKQHMRVVHIETTTDYRLRTLESAGVYFYPLNEKSEEAMWTQFRHLSNGEWEEAKILTIADRPIPTLYCSSNTAWFDFNVLCQVPRSQQDYLEIACTFPTVLLSHVPKIPSEADHLITYLINLVDIFYDARVKLIISAAVPVQELYSEGGRLSFSFQRTCSRLLEMQSHEYLEQPHFFKD